MVASDYACDAGTNDLSDDAIWIELYPKLYSHARHFVYMLRIPCWYGQEEDIVDDVVQETIRRMIERMCKAKRGEATPIYALERMMKVVAQNYIRDLRRRDQRVTHIESDEHSGEIKSNIGEELNTLEIATENVSRELLFQWLAREIADFPAKRRRALLIDLANRMCFDDEPTPLQAAFLSVGIDLRLYQLPVADDAVEHARYASLLSLAYKGIEHLASMEEGTLVA